MEVETTDDCQGVTTVCNLNNHGDNSDGIYVFIYIQYNIRMHLTIYDYICVTMPVYRFMRHMFGYSSDHILGVE